MNGDEKLSNVISDFVFEANEISKRFGERDTVRDISVNVKKNEIVSILGGKYSGKTAFMKIIAGFDNPTSGSVLLNGKSITRTAPYKRKISSIFKDSILFPNMNVWDNISYPLKINGYSKLKTRELAKSITDICCLQGTEKKFPHELSECNKKIVLIARAAASEPNVMLIDDILESLTQSEKNNIIRAIKELKNIFGFSVIYSTSDAETAMQISNRVFIIRNGKSEQSGPPSYLYSRPKTSFAAKAIGKANVIKGKVISVGKFVTVDIGDGVIAAENKNYKLKNGMSVNLCIRPEDIKLSLKPVGNSIKGTVVEQIYSSASTSVCIKSDKTDIFHTQIGMSRLDDGDIVYAEFDPEKTILTDLPT